MTTYSVTFERIGRLRGITADFEAESADDLAEAVFQFARGHLGSKSFDVSVYLEEGRGFIEAGRFGKFTVKELVR